MNEEQQEIQIASVFERAIALILDLLLFFSAWFWSYYLIIQSGNYIAGWQAELYYWFFILFFVIYATWFTANGRSTLGKFLLGIKVVDKNNYGKIALPRSLMRALSYYLCLLTGFAGFGMAILTRDSRALEDYVASTKVIRTREKTAAETALVTAFGIISIALVAIYLYAAIFVMPSQFDRKRVEEANNQLIDISILEDIHHQHFGTYTPDLVRLGLLSGDPVQFQRDVQKNLRRHGFSIGFDKDGYEIKAVAKDSKATTVTSSFKRTQNQ